MQNMMVIGNLVRSVELLENRGSNKNTSMIFMDIAVNRYSKGQKKTDYIHFVAFGKIAKVIYKYSNYPGATLGIKFNMHTSSYVNDEGEKRYSTQNVIEQVKFIGNKKSNNLEKSSENEQYISAEMFNSEPIINVDDYNILGE